ncbi:winged helix-turn-helix domain-containing protein [Pelotomaculum propionicicum]|uniref:winged helix-turn-helix domain-containing protein n=1 Tax=Pelotomaculum propionicicum TaxID=258475 RepID=UPI003B7B96D6
MGTVRSKSNGSDFEGISAKHKLWLEKNGAIFGDGLYNLLSSIAGLGSISQAARGMGMSYRAAWGKIRATERKWGIPLVVARVGGEAGGWARLTPEAEELLETYCRMEQEVDKFMQKLSGKISTGRQGP